MVRRILFLFILVSLLSPVRVFSFNISLSSKIPQWLKPYPFEYNPKNRPDPFKPVIKIKLLKAVKKIRKFLSPLQQYEPTQLNLVGITWDPNKKKTPLALVELPNGKGYILKEGMKVGPNNGVVVAILKDKVIILEDYINFFGKKERKQIILNLKPKK